MKKLKGLFAFAAVVVCALFLPAASKHQASLSPHEELLAAQTGFEREVFMLIREETQEHLHRMSGYNEDGYQIMVDGIVVSIGQSRAGQVLSALRQKLAPRKYMAFIIDMNDGIKTDKIGIIKGTDQYDILRIMQTNGDDYEISNADVIDRLKEWEKNWQFEIIGAENDWVEIEFKSLPRDVKAFAEEVRDFCPDAVDQGAGGNLAGLVKELKATKRLYLWWE